MKKIKILLVEDDPISQQVVKLALESKDYQVTIAGTGSEALELYKSNDFTLILMDMGLSDMSGIEVTREIRKLEKGREKHVPIIALTAHGESAKPECLSAGMDDFATKPFAIDRLNQIIKSWLKILP